MIYNVFLKKYRIFKMIKKKFISITIISSLFILSGCEKKEKPEVFIETGGVAEGDILYDEEMKKDCRMSGKEFAQKYSKDEWRSFAQRGKIGEAAKKICPNLAFKNDWTPDLYEFVSKNAKENI